MGDRTGIAWTDATWNPIVGCSLVSPGCTHCYAMGQAARIVRMTPASHYAGTVHTEKGCAVWTGEVRDAPEHILTAPLRWRNGRKIFVNSMGDLFHEGIAAYRIAEVFAIMACAQRHTFQVLTKRAERMREVLSDVGFWDDVASFIGHYRSRFDLTDLANCYGTTAPLPNVWLGVSAEDQRRYDERVGDLNATPAALRFVSAEPLLGEIALRPSDLIDWVIAGGESGVCARPEQEAWVRRLARDCNLMWMAFFNKQMRVNGKLTRDVKKFPADLQIQDFPR